MASNNESDTVMPDNNPYSTANNNDTWLLEEAKIQVLHEATLQDLLQMKNDVVIQILHECNELLCERCIILTVTEATLTHTTCPSIDFPSEALHVSTPRWTS